MAGEPKGGRRVVEVTARRAKPDFVSFVKHLMENVYAAAETVHFRAADGTAHAGGDGHSGAHRRFPKACGWLRRPMYRRKIWMLSRRKIPSACWRWPAS